MIHDLYLRSHLVVPTKNEEQKKPTAKTSPEPKLWPDYALVWDTETMIDLEQTLNFGVWRFCQLVGTEYVAIQEGIFYGDGLPVGMFKQSSRTAKTTAQTTLRSTVTHIWQLIHGRILWKRYFGNPSALVL